MKRSREGFERASPASLGSPSRHQVSSRRAPGYKCVRITDPHRGTSDDEGAETQVGRAAAGHGRGETRTTVHTFLTPKSWSQCHATCVDSYPAPSSLGQGVCRGLRSDTTALSGMAWTFLEDSRGSRGSVGFKDSQVSWRPCSVPRMTSPSCPPTVPRLPGPAGISEEAEGPGGTVGVQPPPAGPGPPACCVPPPSPSPGPPAYLHLPGGCQHPAGLE